MYICVYMYIYVCVCICVYIFICICVCGCVYICVYVCVYIHVCICVLFANVGYSPVSWENGGKGVSYLLFCFLCSFNWGRGVGGVVDGACVVLALAD